MALKTSLDLPIASSLQDEDVVVVTQNVGTTPIDKQANYKLFYNPVVLTKAWDIIQEDFSVGTYSLSSGLNSIATGILVDYATDFSAGGGHVVLQPTAITVPGTITITGDSIDSVTGVVTVADTETVTVDSTVNQRYMTTKKWLTITYIDIDTSVLTYNIEVLHMYNFAAMDVMLTGYEFSAWFSAATADVSVQIQKVVDDGSKKISFADVENIGLTSVAATSSAIVDNLRTAADDRSRSTTVELSTSQPTTLTATDYDTYHTGTGTNNIYGSTQPEGLIITIAGEPNSGDITGVNRLRLQLFYRQGIV